MEKKHVRSLTAVQLLQRMVRDARGAAGNTVTLKNVNNTR